MCCVCCDWCLLSFVAVCYELIVVACCRCVLLVVAFAAAVVKFRLLLPLSQSMCIGCCLLLCVVCWMLFYAGVGY